jgi:AcrR family transcriptional regulator
VTVPSDGCNDPGQTNSGQCEVPETRTQRRRRRTNRALLDAGVDVIAEVGLAKLTISSITEAADVALGSFYNHFEDRDHYLRVLFIENAMDWLDDVRRIRTEPFRTEADRIAAAVITLVRRSTERPAWGLFLAEAIAAEHVTQSNMIADLMMPTLQRGIEEGSFAIPDVKLGSRLFLGTVRQSLLYLNNHEAPAHIESELARIILRMLGTPEVLISPIVTRAAKTLESD